LILSNAAVAYTSHLGGSLTHGEDYLTEYVPLVTGKIGNEPARDPSQATVYDDMILPVFEAKCIGCHNESRAKGELSMVTLETMMKGGESGIPGIVPGHPDSSELYKRIILPEGHEDRMPPEGKAPFTAAETALLNFWIASGAARNLSVEDASKDTAARPVIAEVAPNLKRYRRIQELSKLKTGELERELEHLEMRLNVIIERDSAEEENLYSVRMKFPPAPFSSDHVRELLPYGDVFSKLSLVSSGIQDDALYHISKMPNLRKLYLQKTNIDGSGIVHLKKLQKLEVLNLSYTKVDDRSAIELLNVPNVREVYLFRSNTSDEVAKALQAYRPAVQMLLEEGPYW